jgi:predicted Zn-dependent protease
MGVADDGDRVTVFDAIDVHDPSSLPDQGELLARAEALVDELEALVAAPRVGPYQGPVLLSGKASAVFFHEVMGHRVEGHRQKADDEGKTFLEFVGRPVMPPWVDAYDDPTLKSLHGVDLNGFYAYDDEGVAARRAPLVEDGVFEGFLMSRSPLQAFVESNGHGRRSAGKRPVSRMGNTIVEAAKTAPMAELRRRLLAEAKSQGLEYAYIVEEIEGGFTLTGRVIPNAFNVRASRTRRVWVDGRADELVRGIDLVGTPLVAFQSILAAGDTPEVFNGTCGAESGWVPVSAVAPPLLFSRLEFQLKEKSSQRPPLLDKPGAEDGEVVLP